MAKKSLTGLLLLAVTASLWGSGNPWGNLKKMYFYSSVNNLEQVRRNLAELSSESTSRREKEEIAGQLLQLADHYFQTKNYALAREFYQKILVLSPDAWAVFNSLEMIERAQGRKLINPVYAWQQLHHSLRNFDSSYLLVSNFFNVLFFAWLLVFFLFTMVEFVKYFKLAINDCALNRKREFSLLRLFLVIVFFLWPIVVVGGWGIYPFLIAGFLWGYLNGYEKTVCRWILGLLLFFSLLLAFNRYLARSVTSEPFDLARRIYEGELLAEKSSHPPLDNQLKVLQAYTLYEHRQFAGALELLNTVDKNYRSILKFNLLGSIFFENGNIGQSMQYFREALGINDKDPTTLKNFTLALLKSNDPKMLDSYRGRYPQIGLYKQSVQSLEKLSIPERFLWKRALSFGQPTFPAWDFFRDLSTGVRQTARPGLPAAFGSLYRPV